MNPPSSSVIANPAARSAGASSVIVRPRSSVWAYLPAAALLMVPFS
jgi:hypothetical protein